MERDWRKIYTGRDAELGELLKSWEKVKSSGGPHVHVVRGERGMGKTRLVLWPFQPKFTIFKNRSNHCIH